SIRYNGKGLKVSTRYYWTVIVWDKDNQIIQAKEQGYFETGLRSSDGVTGWDGAKWISMAKKLPKSPGSPMFRKEGKLHKKVKGARLYISALGVYDVYINGKKLGITKEDNLTYYELLPPGWTNYDTNIN